MNIDNCLEYFCFLYLSVVQYYRQCTPIITKGEMTKRENGGIKLCTLARTAFIHRYANVHNNLCGASMWPERKMNKSESETETHE